MSAHSVLRYEAALKVTGSAVYEAEVPAAGLLHAALVQAPLLAAMCCRSTRRGRSTFRASRQWSPMRMPRCWRPLPPQP